MFNDKLLFVLLLFKGGQNERKREESHSLFISRFYIASSQGFKITIKTLAYLIFILHVYII